MATASSETTATATVVRATERQVRLKLGQDLGGREVTKRVAVPDGVRATIEGTVVPVVVTGSGDRAKVELAEDWLDAADGAKKPTRKRTRGGATATEKAAPKDAAPAGGPKKRTRGAPSPAPDAATEKASGRTRKDRDQPEEAPAKASSGRARKTAKTKAVPPVSPAVVRKQIAAAVALVRGARR